MLISEILPLLTAFGLGSIVTALVQSWLQRKGKIDDRNFEERKKAYVGLLEAYHKAAVEPSDTNSKNFAYWQMRCDLVAPKNVRHAIEKIVTTNDNIEGRHLAHEQLKSALRNDLSVSKE